MSVGPLGIAGAAAATSVTQRGGSEIDKAQQQTSDQAREAASQKNAAKAIGVSEAEKEEKTGDRDADGRRLWGEDQPRHKNNSTSKQPANEEDTSQDTCQETATPDPLPGTPPEKGAQLDLDA